MVKQLPSLEYLNECFSLGGKTGLIWKQRPLSHFKSQRDYNIWNTKFSKKEAGTLHRYWLVGINNCKYTSHRIIYYLFYGVQPSSIIDHRDENKLNNNPSNLRLANESQNGINSSLIKNKKNQLKGISYRKKYGNWSAQIKINYKKIHLGVFLTMEEAHEAYLAAKQKHYGDFLNS